MAQFSFRPFVTAAVGLAGVALLTVVPVSCAGSGVGDPCTPEDEFNPNFSGFKVTEENIESRSFQCQTRLCLVNHFQGRVSCPLGQPPPVNCNPLNNGAECAALPAPPGQTAACTPAETPARACDPTAEPGTPLDPAVACSGLGNCNAEGHFCECVSTCPDPNQVCTSIDGTATGAKVCISHVCHVPGLCQDGGLETALNAYDDANGATHTKDCCVPGTDTPVTQPVCGQCGDRNADTAVYCSCRCGPAGDFCGETTDATGATITVACEAGFECSHNACVKSGGEPDNFNYCSCPDGFECSEIRKNVGLGDKQLTGKYCIKKDTSYEKAPDCGSVTGYFNSTQCDGLGLGL